jgi:hypothetical protein
MTSATSTRSLTDGFGKARDAFRAWRWSRPFWAGLLTMFAGVPIMYIPYRNVTMGQLQFRMATTTGSASLIIGVLLVVLGLTMWFQSVVRVFAGIASILLSLVSLVVSNFGGLFVGFLLGLLGGGLAVAWAPGQSGDGGGDRVDGPARAPLKDADGARGADGSEPAAVGAGAEDDSTNGGHRAG